MNKIYLFAILLLGFFLRPCLANESGIWYKPVTSVKWHIQLQGEVNTSYPAELYDIDLFDSPASLIEQLHVSGKHVICYFSAGSSEKWRPDYSKFKKAEKGKGLTGWPGENWLDIRSSNVKEIMMARIDMAKQKGCDGIDPDNVEGYANKSGFPLTAQDQIDYNGFLAYEAHKKGMAAALKNDLGQIKDLAGLFDFSVNEQCFQYKECEKLKPFIALNKPVLNIEYKQNYVKNAVQRQALCEKSLSLKFSTLILPLGLNNKFRYSCQE